MPIFRRDARLRNPKKKSRRTHRSMRVQQLENRQLLAGDVGMHPNIQVTDTAVITHHDTVPRFAANPTHVAITDGNWSDPATWNRSWIPGRNARVSIPKGMRVNYDLDSRTELDAVEVAGQLDFYRWRDTSMRLNELMVLPSGALVMGTERNPMPAQYEAEIVFTDTPGADGLHFKTGTVEQPGIDPSQYGNGLIVFGRLDVHGAAKTPFVRAVGDIQQGDSTFNVDTTPTGWRSDDDLVIPETAQTVITIDNQEIHETEVLQLETVQGTEIGARSSTAYDHLGISQNRFGVDRYPHIANISRSIVFRSENPNGVRGHFAAMGTSRINISNAEFRSMGRTSAETFVDNTAYDELGNPVAIGTNQIARYPVHMHHLTRPFEIDGIVVRDGLKWGITVHGSDNGVVQNNVVYDVDGAGIVTEDGDESGNSFLNNLVLKVDGGHQKNTVRGGAAKITDEQGKTTIHIGADGSGFWLRASEGTFEDNVVYDAAGYGFNFNGYFNRPWLHDNFEFRQLESFTGNEVVSSKGGLWFSWSQGQSDIDQYQAQTVSDFLAWHVSHEGVKAHHEANLAFEDITVIANPEIASENLGSYGNFHLRVSAGLSFENELYENHNVDLQNIRVEGANIGIIAPSVAGEYGTLLRDATLANYVNIAFQGTADVDSLDYSEVAFLPSLARKPAASFPSTVANVWHEAQGTLEYGWQQIDGAHVRNQPAPTVQLNQQTGQLTVLGGQQHDSVYVSESGNTISLFSNGHAFSGSMLRFDRDEISQIRFFGNGGDDVFLNFSSKQLFAMGGEGNDAIVGGSANDRLVGEAGNDFLFGAGGFDLVTGDQGADVFGEHDQVTDLTAVDRRDLALSEFFNS